MALPHENGSSVIGSVRRFGQDGVAYEVIGLQEDNPALAHIVLVETGEHTHYPLEQLMADPVIH